MYTSVLFLRRPPETNHLNVAVLPLDACHHPPPPPTRRESFCSVGYTPIMTFDVGDLQETVTRMLQRGAQMDGAIQYLPDGSKVWFVFLRSWRDAA